MIQWLTFGGAVTLLDQALKTEIEKLPDETFPHDIKDFCGLIRLYKNHNPGFSFGFFKEYPKIVEMVPACVCSAVFGVWAYAMTKRGKLLEKAALTLALAGGVSNLYDRMRRGYVVDYFCIRWKKLKEVVLNLGDVCIFAGSTLFVMAQILEEIGDLIPKKNQE